jgi:hypothetical protein
LVCNCPNINHNKVERAFCEYIQQINDFTEIVTTSEDNTKKVKQEIMQTIVEYEKKLNALHERKKQTMERYASGEIEFNEYREVVCIMNERGDVLEREVQRKKSELPIVTEEPNVSAEEIIINIRQNWEHLNNNERMMFLHRFVKKIVITVEKKNRTCNTIKINSVEFQSV